AARGDGSPAGRRGHGRWTARSRQPARGRPAGFLACRRSDAGQTAVPEGHDESPRRGVPAVRDGPREGGQDASAVGRPVSASWAHGTDLLVALLPIHQFIFSGMNAAIRKQALDRTNDVTATPATTGSAA